MRGKITAAEATEDTFTSELTVLEATYENLKALSEDVAGSETTREILKTAVPSGYDQDALLLELSALASDAGFTLNAVTFSDTVSEEYGKTITMAMSLAGTYDDLVAFLQAVEGAERLMRVTSMSIQRTSGSAISFNLSIEAYYQ
ncbi:MAG: type 4a pilus biogenesis protein PilO [Candidatus Gracilibacteria bacterium]